MNSQGSEIGPALPARGTARDLVADYVRQAVGSGQLEPGQKLNVAAFARELGVSHTPAREAFQLLASEGLLQINAYRGARVADLSADEYEEIFLMRVGLEGLAARLGASAITTDGVTEMEQLLAKMEEAAAVADIGAFLESDRAFHAVHYRASQREPLWRRIIALRHAAERYTRVAYQLPRGGLEDTITSHRELLAAVRARDGARAERIMKDDLKRTYLSLVRELRANPEFGKRKQ